MRVVRQRRSRAALPDLSASTWLNRPSLLQYLLYTRVELLGGDPAGRLAHHAPVAPDEDRLWHSGHAVRDGGFPVAIWPGEIGDLVLLQERLAILLCIVEGQTDEHHPTGVVLVVPRLQGRHLLLTRRAPGRPEVEDDRLALEVSQMDRLPWRPVPHRRGEVRRGVADERVGRRGGDGLVRLLQPHDKHGYQREQNQRRRGQAEDIAPTQASASLRDRTALARRCLCCPRRLLDHIGLSSRSTF